MLLAQGSYSQGQVKRGHMDSLLHRRQVDEESAWHCSKIVCKVLNCRNGPIAIYDHSKNCCDQIQLMRAQLQSR